MMSKPETDAVDLLATRVAGGLLTMKDEQRARFFTLLALEFCPQCGARFGCGCAYPRSADNGRL